MKANGLTHVAWPAAVVLVAVVTAATVLTLQGHSNDVGRASVILVQGVGFLLNFWVAHRAIKPAADKIDQTAAVIEHLDDHPTFEDLAQQLAILTNKVAAVEQTTVATQKKIDTGGGGV